MNSENESSNLNFYSCCLWFCPNSLATDEREKLLITAVSDEDRDLEKEKETHTPISDPIPDPNEIYSPPALLNSSRLSRPQQSLPNYSVQNTEKIQNLIDIPISNTQTEKKQVIPLNNYVESPENEIMKDIDYDSSSEIILEKEKHTIYQKQDIVLKDELSQEKEKEILITQNEEEEKDELSQEKEILITQNEEEEKDELSQEKEKEILITQNEEEEKDEISQIFDFNIPYNKELSEVYDVIKNAMISTDDWVNLGTEEEIDIYTKLIDDTINVCKGIGVIDSSASVIYKAFTDFECRIYWDEMFENGYNIEVYSDNNTACSYFSFKSPSYFVYARDLCVAGKTIRYPDQSLWIISTSVYHPKCPEKEPYVRANLTYAATVIVPLFDDNNVNTRCRVTYITAMDPKGYIPQMIVDAANKRSPLAINEVRKLIVHRNDLFK